MIPILIRRSAALIIAVVGSTAVAKAQDSVTHLVEKAKHSVVSVVTYDKGGNALARATGFFISNTGLVATRRRVFAAGTNRAEVRMADGKSYPIKRISIQHAQSDLALALVDVPETVVEPLAVAREVPQMGEHLVTISSDGASGLTVQQGSVSGIEDSPVGKMIRVAASLGSGSNGSPVINMKGEVVGVANYLREGEQSFNAITGAAVANLYARSPDHDDLERPRPLNRPMPSYTERARENRVEGVVVARVLVGEDGKVQRVRVTQGLPDGLDDEAVKAIFRMKFKPATKSGQPTKFWVRVDVAFKLR
jgi:TonB family protein